MRCFRAAFSVALLLFLAVLGRTAPRGGGPPPPPPREGVAGMAGAGAGRVSKVQSPFGAWQETLLGFGLETGGPGGLLRGGGRATGWRPVQRPGASAWLVSLPWLRRHARVGRASVLDSFFGYHNRAALQLGRQRPPAALVYFLPGWWWPACPSPPCGLGPGQGLRDGARQGPPGERVAARAAGLLQPHCALRRLLAFGRCWCSSPGGPPNCPATGCGHAGCRPVDSPRPPRTAPAGGLSGGRLLWACPGTHPLGLTFTLALALDVKRYGCPDQRSGDATLRRNCWQQIGLPSRRLLLYRHSGRSWPWLGAGSSTVEPGLAGWLLGLGKLPLRGPFSPVRRPADVAAWRWRAGAARREMAAAAGGSQARVESLGRWSGC